MVFITLKIVYRTERRISIVVCVKSELVYSKIEFFIFKSSFDPFTKSNLSYILFIKLF